MTWDVARLRHNASVLYNDLCSYDGDKVYVDGHGDLQFDDRFSVSIQNFPLGDYSRQATDKVAVRTLRKVLHALDLGVLDRKQIIKEKRVPLGCREEDKKGFLEISNFVGRAHSDGRWLDHKTFAHNISLANRFKPSSKSIFSTEMESFRRDLLHRRIVILSAQIQMEQEKYRETQKILSRFERYDFSSDEEI